MTNTKLPDNVRAMAKSRGGAKDQSMMDKRQAAGLVAGREAKRAKAARARAEREARAEAGIPEPKSRLLQLLAGDIEVRELDDDELRKGKCRDRLGEFAGPDQLWPRKIAQQRTAELLRRGQDRATSLVPSMMKVLMGIALDPLAKEADRIKAANILLERGAGRVTEHVVVHSSDPWQDILDGVIYDGQEAQQTPTQAG